MCPMRDAKAFDRYKVASHSRPGVFGQRSVEVILLEITRFSLLISVYYCKIAS